MSELRIPSTTVEAAVEATGLPATQVRAALQGDDVPVSVAVKVGGFLGLSPKEIFA